MKVLARIALTAGVAALLTATGAAVWTWSENRPREDGQARTFRIPPGEALATTAQRLADAKLIRNPQVFRWIYQLFEGGAFPSGTFAVPGGLSARAAANFFHHAQPLQVRVTVPEGWTASKIARLLEEKGVVSASSFLDVVAHPDALGTLGQGLATLDGRLFPDTYQFPVEAEPVDVARIFVQTFRERTKAWAALPPDQFTAKVILASIVEREYRVPEEAPVIASVFQNRLDEGINLASCATIEYILTEVMGRPHPKRIFIVHTQIPSPFNTYLNKGLPPAAIANPGLTALKAAFQPATTKYLYFVVADAVQGTHTFSSNWSQHEKAREAYLTTFVSKG